MSYSSYSSEIIVAFQIWISCSTGFENESELFWCQNGRIFKSQNASKLASFKTSTVLVSYLCNVNLHQIFSSFLVGNKIIISQMLFLFFHRNNRHVFSKIKLSVALDLEIKVKFFLAPKCSIFKSQNPSNLPKFQTTTLCH